MNDTINLYNNGTEPIADFLIGFDKGFAENLDGTSAYTSLGEVLTIEEGGIDNYTNIYWMRVRLPNAVESNERCGFTVAFAFSKLITYSSVEPTVYTAFFPEYPALAFKASSCMVEINLPSETTLVDGSWGSSNTYLKIPLEENSNQTGFVSFNGTLQYVECSSAKREIVLDSWGGIQSYDTYKIRNLGKGELTGLDFPIPSDAEEVTAYDDFNSLTTTVKESSGKKGVYVTFRYPLRGEENSIQYHESYSFTIHYSLITREHLTQTTPLGSYKFEMDLFPSPNWTLKSLETRVTFQEGANYISASLTPALTSKNLFTQSLVFVTENLTMIHKPYLTIDCEYNVFWSAFRPTLWIGIVIVLVGGVILLGRRRRPKSLLKPRKEVELIGTFIEACGERVGLWNDLETLENDFDRRRIRRKDFNRRKGILEQKIGLIEKDVASLEARVGRIGTRQAELIEKVNGAEVEIHNLHSEIDRLRSQLRTGKLSESAYEKLKDAYDKRIQKARDAIEGAIMELRSLRG